MLYSDLGYSDSHFELNMMNIERCKKDLKNKITFLLSFQDPKLENFRDVIGGRDQDVTS